MLLFGGLSYYCNNPKYWDRHAWTNTHCTDPDQKLQNAASEHVLHFATHLAVFKYTSRKQICFFFQLQKGFNITKKTCLYNFDPLKPHFYIVKRVYRGYTLFLLFLLKNIDCGYLLDPHRGGSIEYSQSMFWAEIWKISEFFIWNFSCFGGKIFSIFEQACFCNEVS